MLEDLPGPVTSLQSYVVASSKQGGSKRRRSTSSIDLTEPGFGFVDGQMAQPKRRGRPSLSMALAYSGGMYEGSAEGGAVDIKREEDKYPRLSAQQVTQRLLSRLMCEGALGLGELARSIPDATKELVGSVLEIMQVLGLVVQYRATTAPTNDANIATAPSMGDAIITTTAAATATCATNPSANAVIATTVTDAALTNLAAVTTSTSSSSSSSSSSISISSSSSSSGAGVLVSSSSQIVYVLAGFARGSEPQEIRNIIEHTAQKKKIAALIQARCAVLQDLTSKIMPCAERVIECRGLLVEAINRDGLQDDGLYRTVAELCGHVPARKFGPA